MAYKPVGVNEDSLFPTRVMTALKNLFTPTEDLSTVATSGKYSDLDEKPDIPSTALSVHAEPEGLSEKTNTLLENTYTGLPSPVVNGLTGWIHVDGFGADKTGVADAFTAITSAFSYAASHSASRMADILNAGNIYSYGPTVYFPDGVFKTTQTLVKPVGVNIRAEESTIIRAAGSAVWTSPLLTTTNKTGLIDQHTSVIGGKWDANFIAQDGLSFPYFANIELRNLTVFNPVRHGIVLGDPGSTTNSYEAMVRNVKTRRNRGASIPAGSYCLWLRASDSYISDCVFNGSDIGVRTETGNNMFARVHTWNYGGSTTQSTGFEDTATFTANQYVECYVDGPSLYGWNLIGGWGHLVSCTAYNTVTDNLSTAVQVGGTQGLVTVVGLSVVGADSTHRWKTDIGGNLLFATVVGTRNTNVASGVFSNSDQMRKLKVTNPGGGTDLGIVKQTASAATDFVLGVQTNGSTTFRVTASGEFSGGGIAVALSSKTASYTMAATDGTVVMSSAVAVTVTLPSVASVPTGRICIVKNLNTGAVTVAAQGSSTIDSGASLAQGQTGWYQSNGTNWIKIN